MFGVRIGRRGMPQLALALNFLIAHYLAQGPLRTAAEPLRQILEDTAQQLLPRRFDWQGNQHTRTYDELVKEYPHIAGSELLNIVQAIANRDSSALLTAGGTVLGRTHKAPPTSNGVENSLVNKLRSRSANPAQSPMNRSTRLPLSVLASFRKLVRCHGHKYPTYCVLFDRT
ncbi:Bromodomain and WD repeat-containing protein 1, partial [Kickxella alabastrina]